MAKKKSFKESLGIDIGTHSIKVVHLKRLHQGYKLLNYGIRQTIPQGMDYTFSDLSNDRHAPILGEMLRSLRIRTKHVKQLVTAIGGDDTSIKQIKTIFLPEDELESALFFEAKKHMPISGSEMILDFQVLSVEEKTNNMNILLASATKDALKAHTDVLNAVGLTPGTVDLEALAVANSFRFNSFVEDGTYVILNIGAHKTNMVVFGPQSKFFTRDISWGGYHFTKDVMKKQKLDFEAAEKYKHENGLIESGDAKEKEQPLSMLDITEKTTEEQIAVEAKRSLRFYVKEAGDSDFRKILLVGGSAKLKGLPEYLQESLNIPVEVFNPFVDLEMPDKFRDKKDPQLAMALGLAMRPD
ncbi:MAG: pilus assembly protein PilM [Candidatus Cloacimonetes bacterium]|nr:pilus assembly protein PilM [Candidatus Cloacimonadota bacterium]